jgi:hypothetical protein
VAWDGYFTYAGQEFINAARTQAYAESAGLGWLRGCYGGDDLALMLGDQTYRSPLLDPAPWMDPDRPESYGFYGVYPLGVTGIEDSTRVGTVVESISDGGTVGRIRQGTRSVVFNVALVGANDCACDYGARWLRRLLMGAACSTQASEACAGDDLCYLSCEPQLDWSDPPPPPPVPPPTPLGYRGNVMLDNPVAYYRLGETGGTVMVDETSNTHNGTYFATKTAASGLLTGDTDGGSNQTSFVGNPAWMDLLAPGGLTLECLVRPNSAQSNRGIFTRYDSAHLFLLWMNVSGQIAVRFYNNLGASVDLAWATAPTPGQTYHVAASYVSGQARLYINGTQVASSTALTGPMATSGTQSLEIGTYQNNTFSFDGTRDEFAVYSGELSAIRIAAHATEAFSPTVVPEPEPQPETPIIDVLRCLDPYQRSLRRVVFNTGPTFTSKQSTSDGGAVWTATMTAVAGNPYEFGVETPIVEGFGVAPDPYVCDPPGTFNLNGPVVTDDCRQQTYQPVFDPSCPAFIAPPQYATVKLGCYTPPENWRRRQFTIPEEFIPLWGEVVPKIEIHASAKNSDGKVVEVRNLRLRFYADVDGDGDTTDDLCAYCGDIVVSYVPAGETLVLDGSDQLVYVQAPGGTGQRRADSLVYATDGTPFEWPVLSCGFGYIVAVDVEQGTPMPKVDLSLFARAAA